MRPTHMLWCRALLGLICCVVVPLAGMAQDSTFTKEEIALLDSMIKNDPLWSLFKEKPQSYGEVRMGAGNGVFSLRNQSLNSIQTETKTMYGKLAAGYYHKSGVSVQAGMLTALQGNWTVLRYSLSPSYQFSNKLWSAGMAYTYFIPTGQSVYDISPFQHDVYANGSYKKWKIQPGLALGYSAGRIREYFDTSFIIDLPNLPPRNVHITDTITTKLQSFSATASATYKWSKSRWIGKKDDWLFLFSLMLTGSDLNMDITHSNSLQKRRPIVQKALKRLYGDGTRYDHFQLQSLAFSTQISWGLGHFSIEPNIYLDYYLPSTTENRLTCIVELGLSYLF